MDWLAPASGKRGRAEKFSDAAIQFCLMVKNLFGLALRQVTGMVESLLKLSCLDWPTPDYSTLCRRQQRLQVCISYRLNPNGLHLLVDSIGVKMLGEGEYPKGINGKPRSTVPSIVASGARFIWVSTPKRWKFERLKSRRIAWVMLRYCRIFSASSCWVNALMRDFSTARSPSYRFGLRC